MKKRRPATRTIKRVFKWLNEHGLSVYGSCIDPETGQGYYGFRDYNAEDAIKVAQHIKKGTVKEPNEEDSL